MNRISAYQIPLSVEAIHAAASAADLSAALAEPLQALVTTITRRAGEGPLMVYLAAEDGAAAARDDFAFALARVLTAHVPSALLVDCDFLGTGLHGRVPQKDALGFLDFLLYGSSIGVITQETGGVHVVGAGSFPVGKRMPFVDSAFADASRRLVAHARCALFVGPLFEEGGAVHPLTGEVDVVVTVRTAVRDPRLDAAEESIAAGRAEVWSVRLGGEPVSARTETPPAAPAHAVPVAEKPARPPAGPVPAAAGERTYSSLAPRIAVLAFGVLVIAFVGWWLAQNRRAPGADETASTAAPSREAPATLTADTARASADTALTDSVSLASGSPADSALNVAAPPPVNPADTGGRSGGTVLVNPSDIHVMDDLERLYNGWYVIHISSFQESIRARDEVAFLQSREFPVFIVFLDLGAKGKWYRVYAGPFPTREEARAVKKNLDAVPQVRFTRITTIPE